MYSTVKYMYIICTPPITTNLSETNNSKDLILKDVPQIFRVEMFHG
jgi:hypothetical protein